MVKIAITTDTNSGMEQEEAEQFGIFMLPMPFVVNDTDYLEGVTCTYDQFFEMLSKDATVSSSQPSAGDLIDFWEEILKTYDYIVHIPMSSSLSGACNTAMALAQDYDGRIEVVDNRRISLSQRQSAIDAVKLAAQGKSAAEIKQILEETGLDASIYLAVNTLEYLKKSGRVTAAGAALATVLNIKPVLQIQGGKLDAVAKARGMHKAEKIMIETMKKDLAERFKDKPVYVQAAYSGDLEPALEWQKKIQTEFPGQEVILRKLPLSICCHVGAGVKAIACVTYL